jgi:hypothetical protein
MFGSSTAARRTFMYRDLCAPYVDVIMWENRRSLRYAAHD